MKKNNYIGKKKKKNSIIEYKYDEYKIYDSNIHN